MATKKAEIESIATGRRKTAIARVRLSKGSGQIVVNDRKFEDYFPTTDLRLIVAGRYDYHAFHTTRLQGQGYSGTQAVHRGALTLGLERGF